MTRRRKAVISLVRRTTWRCGKLQKQIVKYLQKKSKAVSIAELTAKFSPLTSKGREGIVRSIQRLAQRNIIKVTPT